MQEIQYVGEHLWVQNLGYAVIVIALISALYTALTSILSYRKNVIESALFSSWGRIGLVIHQISILGIIGLILYMMMSHFFEYHYVWEHVSDDLPMKYILSAFWEGQEGSFLLWMFWNVILCWMLIAHKNYFTNMNIGIIMSVQSILLTMILGIYIGDFRIGSNPFLLLRQSMDIPLFQNPIYVSLIKGNGLNPLLQNYWMLIHPPTLFLGFASTILPFSYALSGLITKQYKEWLKPCLKWSLFSGSILGLGILMGGIWAYEALSFGGYWAWDPVENMSLVPWLVLVAGIHSHLIAQATPYSNRASFIFYFLTYSLVIYSTYLTRSGVLGDTSVHAFTGLGLGYQLVGFIVLVALIPMLFYLKRRNEIPAIQEEERLSSREFWMFIGSLILLFSAGLISFTTSIPVYNKLLDLVGNLIHEDMVSYHRSSPVNVVAHHNRFQIWIAVIIALLSGISLFLKYIGNRKLTFSWTDFKPVFWAALAGMVLSGIIGQFVEQCNIPIYILIFSSIFGVLTNLMFVRKMIQAKSKYFASAISHFGFAVLLLGIIFTGLNRKNIVPEKFFQEEELFSEEDQSVNKHFLLFKNEPKFASNYWINFDRDTLEGRFRKYSIHLRKEDSVTGDFHTVDLHPDVQYDNKMTKIAAANPYIKHYWNKDLFSLIAQIPKVQTDVEEASKAEDSLRFQFLRLKKGDTIFGQKNYYLLTEISNHYTPRELSVSDTDLRLQFKIKTGTLTDSNTYELNPAFVLKNNSAYKFPFNQEKIGVRIEISDSIVYLMEKENRENEVHRFSLKEFESIEPESGLKFKLVGFNKNPENRSYSPKQGDIAIGANLEVEYKGRTQSVMPIYLIRDQHEYGVSAYLYEQGFKIGYVKIHPEDGRMDFEYSRFELPSFIPVRVAENVPRTDYIVMEIIEFPGINLVWTGSLLMVFGMALAAYYRKK